MGLKGYSYAVIAAISNSLFPVLSKSLSENLSPLLLSTLVFVIAASLVSRTKPIRPNKLLTSIAITGAVAGPILFFYGVTRTTASNAAILSNSELVFTAVLALIIFKDKLNLLAVLVVTIGVFVTSAAINPNFSTTGIIGDLLVFSSGLFFALDNNLTQIATRHQYTATKVLQIKFILGALITAIIMLALGVPINIKFSDIPVVLLLGSVAYALPLFMLFKSIREIGAVNSLMIITAGYNLSALLFAYIFLHEHIPVIHAIFGIGIICAGVYFLMRPRFSLRRLLGDRI